MELTDKAKALLAKRGFDPVLVLVRCGAPSSARSRTSCPRRSSFEEVGPGQVVTVDVDNWDGEGAGEDAVFTFTGSPQDRPSRRRT